LCSLPGLELTDKETSLNHIMISLTSNRIQFFKVEKFLEELLSNLVEIYVVFFTSLMIVTNKTEVSQISLLSLEAVTASSK